MVAAESPDEIAKRGAREVLAAVRGRRRLQPLPPELRPRSLDEAYAVQMSLHELLVPERGALAGYKIAVTSPAAQRLMGIDHPCSGAVFSRRIQRSPTRVRHADYVHPIAECEIAVRLGDDLPGAQAPYDRDSVADAIAACMAAVEIADDQRADYASTGARELVAWNGWHAGLVLGPAVTAWRGLDLAALQASLRVGDEAAETGHGRDVLGHPLNAVAWLANHLAERGLALRRGMVVTTGSIVAPRWPEAGSRVVAEVQSLGRVCIEFE